LNADFRRPNIYLWTSRGTGVFEEHTQGTARKELSLENTLTVLLMGGSLELVILKIPSNPLQMQKDIQIIAVAARTQP